ncbi:MAG TPA: hypothetical protein PL193_12345 [Xanthobacteraceae bacterium]|nr:hypothetical protein [Xanthobacteraceae bacterium]
MRLLAATFAVALCAASSAQAREINRYNVGGWQIGVFTNDQSGRFSHCAASGNYRNGLTLLFSVSESLEWAIGFSSPEWRLTQGRDFDVEFRIDGGRVNNVRGRAVTDRLVRATLPDNVGLFNQFRLGLRMVVSLNDNPEVTFNLSNTNAMLTEILNCARKNKGYSENPTSNNNDRPRGDDRDTRPQRDDRDNRPRNDNRPRESERDTGSRSDNRTPLAPQQNQNRVTQTPQRNDGGSSGSFRANEQGDNRVARVPDRERDDDNRRPERRPVSPPANTPALGPTPDSRQEATQIATDILRRANFSFEFQKPEQLNADLRDRYDVVWRADEFLGTLRIHPDARADNIERVRSSVISADTAACKGKLDTGTLPAMADSKSVTMFTACKGAQVSSTYYILLPRRRGGIYLLGIAGTGEVAARLQNVANAYRTVALEVVEK